MSFQRDFLSKRITDPLAKKIHDLGQEEFAQNFQVQNIDTLNVQILSIKTKTKTLSKDKFHVSSKSYNPDQRFYNAVYPDRNKLKLWIKGENSDKLHDYSLLNHNAHLWSPYQVAEQYLRDDPDNMAGHEIVSYANSTHYVHVVDSPDLRITDLVVNEPTRAGFTILTRFNPLGIGKSKQDSRIIDQKIDSSQNRYGHSINIDENGDIYFYVKYNYRQYFAKLENPIVISLFEANYQVANFKSKNYKTETKIVAEEFINDSYDLACEFIYSTKECIIKLLYDGQIIASASSLTGTNSLPPNLQLRLPLQEGNWSEVKTLPANLPMNQVFDMSTNQAIGTISNLGAGGQWNADNTLTSNGLATSALNVAFGSITALNTLTEFTVTFWFNPGTDLVTTGTRELFSKGLLVASSFRIFRDSGQNNVRLVIYNTGSGDFSGVIFPNAFPIANTWYFVTCKWKSGEKLKISVNNATDVTNASNLSMTITNSTNHCLLYRSTNGAIGTILNLMVFNRQITATEQTQLYNYGPHTAQFPTNLEPQRLPNPAPIAVTNPINTIYDLQPLPSPTAADYVYINNPSSQNPFVPKYDAPDGTVSAIPEATIYNIAPGTGGTTTNPVATPYTLPPANSTGQIQFSSTSSNNEWGYVQYVLINTSVIYNQKFTEIQVTLNGLDNPTGGTVWLGIIKNDGTKIKFGASIDPTTLPDAWTNYTRQLFTNTYPLAVGDGIGVIWEGGTGGSVNVARGGNNVHFDKDGSGNPRSCQNGRRGTGIGEWKTPNETYSMAGVFKTGGDTTGTSPYYDMKNATGFYILVGEYFPATSPMLGEIPTYASFRVFRDAAATNGTVSIRHVKADGTYWATLYGEINVSTLPTTEPTDFNFVWTNFDYTRAIIAGDRIAVVVTGQTTGLVKVLTNIGNSGAGNSYNGSTSILNMRNFAGTFSSSATLDLAGVIKKGGSSFSPIIKFSATVTRIYERCINASSSFYDQPLSRVLVRGKRTGTIPSPSLMTCTLKNNANADKVIIGTYDANSVSSSAYQDIIFTNNNNTVKVAPGDYVSIELATCTDTNFIELNMTKNIDAGNSIMGTLTSGVITDQASFDLAGKFYIGGQVDNVSRKRVAQYIDTQDSIFLTVPNNRVTILDVILSSVGLPTGLVYFNIRRGSDDALIFNLGSISASTITTALTGTPVHITNFNNTYILAAKDKLSIEYEAGDQLNKIGVHVRTVTPDYDGINSYIARHNGIEYDYMNTKDLVATMKVGGDTYMPEANAPPPVLPQNPTDLFLLANSSKKETSYLRCIFGMYLFFHTILTDEELINFNVTRIDTGNNPPNQIQVTNHSFFRSS